jgi:hypothetical protein
MLAIYLIRCVNPLAIKGPESTKIARSLPDCGKGKRNEKKTATATVPANIERRTPAVSPSMKLTATLFAPAHYNDRVWLEIR